MLLNKILSRFLLLFLFFFFAPDLIAAQSDSVFNLTTENFKKGAPVDASKANWKYHGGDDAKWAAPDFDDGDWQTINGETNRLEKLMQPDWRGVCWLRLHFKSDEKLRGKVVGLIYSLWLAGSEIYLDGELVRRYGDIKNETADSSFVSVFGTPFAAKFTDSDEHLLAVRYRSAIENPELPFSQWLYRSNDGSGFYLAFVDINDFIASREQSLRSSATTTISRAGIYLAVGLVYLLLFWFYPPQRANFYFGIYAFLTAVNTFVGYLPYAGGNADLTTFIIYRALGRFLFLGYSLAFLLFLYRAFLPRTPRFFLLGSAIWTLTNVAAFVFPQSSVVSGMFGVMTIVFVAECLRVMWVAIRRRAEGAWIVALGVLTALLAPLRYLYLVTGLTIPRDFDYYLSFLSSYGMLAAAAIYLARNFARINKDLAAQLVNVRELSARALEHERTEAELRLKHEHERAENERRAKELEEARRLQLSLLPKKLPELPHLEIAAFMKPATEVGGDYYDFHLGGDGTLTIAVGDATGHGLKAGTMVTATKSLFNNLADEPDISAIFKSSSVALKRMNLRGMFMAMTMAKIKNNCLIIGCAGMPPALVYRAATGQVEEFTVKALPLGSPVAADYEQRELTLAPGDCILLMSDGFPEMFNHEGEMLGFDKAAEILPDVAHRTPQEIVDSFAAAASDWANGRPQDDDITFVVLKIKADAL